MTRRSARDELQIRPRRFGGHNRRSGLSGYRWPWYRAYSPRLGRRAGSAVRPGNPRRASLLPGLAFAMTFLNGYLPRSGRHPDHRASSPRPYPATGTRLAHESGREPGLILSVRRPSHSWDPSGHSWTHQRRLDPAICAVTCENDIRRDWSGRSQPPGRPSWEPRPHAPLTCLDLAHDWPTATGNGLPNRSRTHRRPGHRGTPGPGLTLGLCGRCWVRTNVG
jgi:hypothetical protein